MKKAKLALVSVLSLVVITLASAGIANAETYVATLEIVSPVSISLNPNAMVYSPAGDITGEIVNCGLGYPEDFPLGGMAGKIALILRGELLFWEKTQNAAAAGALAVIIYNNVPGNFVGTLGSVTDIPAVSISDEEGFTLLMYMDFARLIGHLTVTIIPSPSVPEFDLALPMATSIAVALYVVISKRYKK